MQTPLRYLLITVFCTLTVHASAARWVENLYETIWIVPENARDSEIRQAMTNGFLETVIRVSGDSAAGSDREMIEASKNARSYLAAFHYEPSAEVLTNVLGEIIKTKKLVMEFSEPVIQKILADAGLPVWDHLRPEILTWIAIEQGGRRELLARGDQHDIADMLVSQAELKGLPVQLPELDVTDNLAITSSEVWGQFGDSIANASERYGKEYNLAGRVFESREGQWQADWLLQSERERLRFTTTAETSDQTIELMMNRLAENLSRRYAVASGSNNTSAARLKITEITALRDYAAIEELFSEWRLIKDYQLVHLGPDNITVELNLLGDNQQFKDLLYLNRELLVPQIADISEPAETEETIQVKWQSTQTNTGS